MGEVEYVMSLKHSDQHVSVVGGDVFVCNGSLT